MKFQKIKKIWDMEIIGNRQKRNLNISHFKEMNKRKKFVNIVPLNGKETFKKITRGNFSSHYTEKKFKQNCSVKQ